MVAFAVTYTGIGRHAVTLLRQGGFTCYQSSTGSRRESSSIPVDTISCFTVVYTNSSSSSNMNNKKRRRPFSNSPTAAAAALLLLLLQLLGCCCCCCCVLTIVAPRGALWLSSMVDVEVVMVAAVHAFPTATTNTNTARGVVQLSSSSSLSPLLMYRHPRYNEAAAASMMAMNGGQQQKQPQRNNKRMPPCLVNHDSSRRRSGMILRSATTAVSSSVLFATMTTQLHATSSSDLKMKERGGGDSGGGDNGGGGGEELEEKAISSSSKAKKKSSSSSKATSSSSTTTTGAAATKFPKDGVVSRLKQAATRACAAAALEEQDNSNNNAQRAAASLTPNNNHSNMNVAPSQSLPGLASLRKLTAAIDAQLSRTQQQRRFGLTTPYQHQQQQLSRDSMTAVMTHNDRVESSSSTSTAATSALLATSSAATTATTTTPNNNINTIVTVKKHVATVLSKSLQDDQITIEYAARIQRLVRAMLFEDYRPDVICFVGGGGGIIGSSTSNSVSSSSSSSSSSAGKSSQQQQNAVAAVTIADCDVGYTYFRHLAASNQLDLTGITFHLERSTVQTGALDRVAERIQEQSVPVWMEAIAAAEEHHVRRRRRRLKLHVQFALVSSEYQLCILNDIHVRSPGQSRLRALERWSASSSSSHKNSDHDGTTPTPKNSINPASIQLETSWTYLYATTANMSLLSSSTLHGCPVTAFSAACYLRAQELVPVLQNLRGVVADAEFFQRDNYRVLVQARRALVSGMERLYQQQPSLAAVHKVMSPSLSSSSSSDNKNGDDFKKPMDVVLEGALLSLGRCLDLVRPAGLLTGSVPAHDFRLAVTVLEQAVSQITLACDPDKPLPPSAWGVLPKQYAKLAEDYDDDNVAFRHQLTNDKESPEVDDDDDDANIFLQILDDE